MAIFPLIREGLFLMDPEKAHRLTIKALSAMGRVPLMPQLVGFMQEVGHPKKVTLFKTPERPGGVTFLQNVPGISAGFDKHAEAVPLLCRSGASHLEIGSILPKPQIGNDRPRLFRIRRSGAVINRYGFNSDGSIVIAKRLREYKHLGLCTIPIGLNYGMMKETAASRSIGRAAEDHVEARSRFIGLGDYNVSNLSSPNTANLRDFQYETRELLRQVVDHERWLYRTRQIAHPVPWLVKLSPDDLDDDDALRSVIYGAEEAEVEGFIISNTTKSRPGEVANHPLAKEQGGLSGRLVYPLMMKLLQRARKLTNLPIIVSGGIDHVQKNRQAHDEGATLTQVYTPLIFAGPKYFKDMRWADR